MNSDVSSKTDDNLEGIRQAPDKLLEISRVILINSYAIDIDLKQKSVHEDPLWQGKQFYIVALAKTMSITGCSN